MIDKIKQELARVSADNVHVERDTEFDPEAGELVKIQLDDAYWHMQPNPFLELLKELPVDAGSEGVHLAIEGASPPVVYRGTSPDESRDT